MTDRPSAQFRLAPVLRAACGREQQLVHQVSLLLQTHRAEETRLRVLRELLAGTLEEAVAREGEPLSPPRVLQAQLYAEVLEQRIRLQVARVEQSSAELRDGQAQLLEASQRRQMLVKLQERQQREWRSYEERLDALEAIEVGSAQFVRRRAEESGRDAAAEAAAEGRTA